MAQFVQADYKEDTVGEAFSSDKYFILLIVPNKLLH